ncbi:MAG: recombinase RecQ [Bacteroidetes bacterium]|nr:MAG: recombinase RecQ [Bacteroidota bacterium]
MTIQQILTKYWGYSSFRALQEDIINSVLDGKDTLALLPTGGGKSICFQVPTLAKEGVCLVISPLIALMKDQVENLKKRGISAAAVVSGMHSREIDIAFENCVYGKTKFLYLSPERLTTDIARERIAKMNVNLIAVDEAHCISQWGYDFRPLYLKIAEIRELHPQVPIMALTATATPEVVEDIQEKLNFKEKNVLQKSFERKNLAYVVIQEDDKLGKLLRICSKVQGTGIVYVRNRKKTQEIAEFLRKNKVSADFYHAGLTPEIRSKKQDDWIRNRTRVIVSTNAFGMGIDKPNVRFVVHLDLPDSLEAYFQEAGRGGRDEKKAYAVLLTDKADQLDLKKQVEESFPNLRTIKNVYQSIANYYQLAVGSAKGQSFDFDISDFCNRYSLKPLTIYNSLKFIEREGYLTVTEQLYNPSKIHFLVNKEELYKFQVANKNYDNFIKLILRSYSGIFDNYAKINESELAKRAETNRDNVISILQKLDAQKILSYLPTSNLPQINFIEERVDADYLRISKENYDERKKAAFLRLEAVLHYASSIRKCRSQMLLAYFDEENTYRCGVCDVCLERNKLEISNLEFEKVSDQIKKVLHKQSISLNEVVHSVRNSREDKTLKVIQWLMDNEKIVYESENKLKWSS